MKSKPQLLAWVTCDAMHIDPASGKHYLLGAFSSIRSREFPVVHPQMVWFLSLTDVSVGEHHLKIALGLLGREPEVIIDRPFVSDSPIMRINLINEIKNLRFEKPGDYGVQIDIDDETLLVTSLPVTG